MEQITNLLDLKKSNLLRIKDLLNTNNIQELKKAKDNQEYLNYCLSKFNPILIKNIELKTKNEIYSPESMFSNYIKLNQTITPDKLNINSYTSNIRTNLLEQEAKYLFPKEIVKVTSKSNELLPEYTNKIIPKNNNIITGINSEPDYLNSYSSYY